MLPSLLIIAAIGIVSFTLLGKSPTESIFGGANQESPESVDESVNAAALPVDFYTTTFSATENPISEGGVWLNGKSTGVDWQNVKTTSEKAFGSQSGSSGRYDDSTAVLKGTFGSNQEASATVFNNDTGGDWYSEVELHLRRAMSSHSATGYEIEFRARSDDSAYCDIVRWNGALGDFTPLVHVAGSQCGVATGDVVRATIVGTTISAYKNDSLVMQASDSTFSSGNPGLGFWLHNLRASGNAASYGFTSFTAQTIADGAAASTLSQSLRLGPHPQVTPRL